MNNYVDANRALWNAWTQLHAKFPFLVQGDDSWWRLPPGEGEIPLLFSLQARKPD